MHRIGHAPDLRGATLTTATVALALAGLTSPSWVVPVRPPQGGEAIRDQLAAGVQFVLRRARRGRPARDRVSLLVAMGRPRPGGHALPVYCPQLLGADFLIATLLLAGGIAFMAPHLAWCFWWDELTTMCDVVRPGPAVTLAQSCRVNNHIINSLLMWVSLEVFGEGGPVVLAGVRVCPGRASGDLLGAAGTLGAGGGRVGGPAGGVARPLLASWNGVCRRSARSSSASWHAWRSPGCSRQARGG